MTIFVCGNCDRQLASADARFCSYCGVHLSMEEDCVEQHQSQRECTSKNNNCNQSQNTNACNQNKSCNQSQNTNACNQNKSCNNQNATSNVNENEFTIEDLHSFALRLRERINRTSGNARRGFRSMTDGMDAGAISRERFVDAVRSTWSFSGTPKELVAATVDKYIPMNNGMISFDAFSEFITNGPSPLAVCSDEQTALSAILLPIQEAFLRKHYTPNAAFRSIHTSGVGYITIDDIRKHIDRFLRVASLSNINDETFKDAMQRAANITGEQMTYHDFSRMLSYPYVGNQQWRRVSTSPQRVEQANYSHSKYY